MTSSRLNLVYGCLFINTQGKYSSSRIGDTLTNLRGSPITIMKTLGLHFSLSNSGQQDHQMENFKMFISSDGWVPKHFGSSTQH